MLRFIRKFQLLILVVGGSLLMVVFLLQPILTKLSPSPLKAKVAKLEDGTSYTRADRQQANAAIGVLKRVNPRALAPRAVGGLGLDPSSDSNVALHWLMLVKMADAAGFVGEAGDGVSYITEIARDEAMRQVSNEVQQRLIQNALQAEQRVGELTNQIARTINRNATISAGSAGGTLEAVYKILAQARGIDRLLSAFQTMPSFSDVHALYAAHETYDSVAVDAVLLNASLISSAIAEPSDEQLLAFFDTYKSQGPDGNEYRIGYTQPTRVQLGWLTLEKNEFINAVKVDRVELYKIWHEDRTRYPGEFAEEKFNLEKQYREDQATDMMIEADRVIRAQVIAATKALPKANGVLSLPDDWESKRPKLEKIAETVVTRINDQFSISLATPALTMIGDRWLNIDDIAGLAGFGQASYRIGARRLNVQALPQFFELSEPNTTGLDVQVGLPLVDPAAQDSIGNRYYAVVLGVRVKGPAETIEDVTRERVVSDYKAIEAFKLLSTRIDELKSAIQSEGSVDAAIELIAAMTGAPESFDGPAVSKNILVAKEAIDPGPMRSVVDPGLNEELYRNAVLEASNGLDPLADPQEVIANPIPVVVALPASHSIALSMVVAPRPLTIEQFRANARRIIATAAMRELIEASTDLEDPFSYNALSKRFGLVRLNVDEDDEPAPQESDSTDSASESTSESSEG